MRNRIGKTLAWLEDKQDFVVEALARTLRPEWIRQALAETGRQSRRDRRLPAVWTLHFVVLLCLFRRVSYVNLLEKLVATFWARQSWGDDGPPCSSAVTKARDRLGVEPFQWLYEHSSEQWAQQHAGLRLKGRRVYALDGTTLKTADTPENRRAFGKPGASRGRSAYPQMRVVVLADAGTRLIRGERHGPYRAAEVNLARELLPRTEAGSILVLDREFLAYDFLWEILAQRRADFVVRLKKNVHPRLIKRLGKGDAMVEVEIPRYYRRAHKHMPRTWRLRRVTFVPAGGKEAIRLLTSLMDEVFTKEDLTGLYRERWEEETITDELKTHLCDCATVNRAVAFRSKTSVRVEQEWYGVLLAYNALRMLMAETADQAEACPRRISFTSALERLREGIWDMGRLPVERLPYRYREMLSAMARHRVPKRPNRHNPRAVKIKMSAYALKRSQRVA